MAYNSPQVYRISCLHAFCYINMTIVKKNITRELMKDCKPDKNKKEE